MSKVTNPLLFSKHFGIDPKHFVDAGLIDPFLNVDTQLFIDPVLLEKSTHSVISKDAAEAFHTHFSNYVRLLIISNKKGDKPWRSAAKLLDLREPAYNGLGYGGSSRSGSSRPEKVRAAILDTSSEIVQLGSKDPDMISLMGFFEENVGPDTISDFTTRVIMPHLAQLTHDFCHKHGVPLHKNKLVSSTSLPVYEGTPLVLIPNDIVRDLPIANDWSDIEQAAMRSRRIREQVNKMLSGIAQPTVKDRKKALRAAALLSKSDFASFVSIVKDSATYYDPSDDLLGYYKMRELFAADLSQFMQSKQSSITNIDELKEFVLDSVRQFQHHVEKGNLWEALWNGKVAKKERAAQLIYYAMADCFCRANNVDISPEANMGGGPIDFKFSIGYDLRVLVELKKSTGTVVHGYKKQLELYKAASRTDHGIFVVIDVGKIGDKLNKIRDIREDRINRGLPASEIVVIDASRKQSASKRK